jgi:hypothetical protein
METCTTPLDLEIQNASDGCGWPAADFSQSIVTVETVKTIPFV